MSINVFRRPLSIDIEQSVFRFLRIAEVVLLQNVSQQSQKRISYSLKNLPWDIVHVPDIDMEAHCWLKHVCEANVKVRSIAVVSSLTASEFLRWLTREEKHAQREREREG